VGQQVLRVDYEPKIASAGRGSKKAPSAANRKSAPPQALAFSDYGFGVATPNLCSRRPRSARVRCTSRSTRVYVCTVMAKAGITSATPNEAELEAEHHMAIGQRYRQLEARRPRTFSEMKIAIAPVTRGRHGAGSFRTGGSALRGFPFTQRSSRGRHRRRRHCSCRLHSGARLRVISSRSAHIANIAGAWWS